MKAFVGNAADEEQVKSAREKEKSQRDRELDDVRTVLANPVGRRFLWRYLSLCGVFTESFSVNEMMTAYNEGRRNIGLKLLADIHESQPDAYLTMMQEAKQD
jgi:hypothetical protein